MTKYVFDPEVLQKTANLGAGFPIGKRWEIIHEELSRMYPGKIYPNPRWVFNSSGNLVCQLALVYASPVEYVAYFGTPIGASGFSGRYPWSDVWDLMVDGRMLTFQAGDFEPCEYGPGDPAFLKRGEGKSIAYIGSTWMIDYARGNILGMMPYGLLAPAFFTTLDYHSAWVQFKEFAKLTVWAGRQKNEAG